MPSRDSCSSRAMPMPPDCTARPAGPAAGGWRANVASRPMPGTATPKQFGPTSRMPWRRQQRQQGRPVRGIQPGCDDHQRPDAAPPAFLGDAQHCRCGDGQHGQVHRSGSAAAEGRHGTPSSSRPEG